MKTITKGQPKHFAAGYLSSAKHQQIEERAVTVAEYIVEKDRGFKCSFRIGGRSMGKF